MTVVLEAGSKMYIVYFMARQTQEKIGKNICVSHGFSGVTFITDPYESKDSL
jgi:hypothetical protein